jgi:hypothetical protein
LWLENAGSLLLFRRHELVNESSFGWKRWFIAAVQETRACQGKFLRLETFVHCCCSGDMSLSRKVPSAGNVCSLLLFRRHELVNKSSFGWKTFVQCCCSKDTSLLTKVDFRWSTFLHFFVSHLRQTTRKLLPHFHCFI